MLCPPFERLLTGPADTAERAAPLPYGVTTIPAC